MALHGCDVVKDCPSCPRAKVTSLLTITMQPIPVPQQQFFRIHMDILGPLPVSKEGFWCLLTIINNSKRMLEVVPLTNIEMETCRDTLIRL